MPVTSAARSAIPSSPSRRWPSAEAETAAASKPRPSSSTMTRSCAPRRSAIRLTRDAAACFFLRIDEPAEQLADSGARGLALGDLDAQRGVRACELGSTLAHAFFQLVARPQEVVLGPLARRDVHDRAQHARRPPLAAAR